HRAPRRIVDELSVDGIQASEYGHPGSLCRAANDAPNADVPDRPALGLASVQHYFAPAFLPTLRRMCSSAYLMPLLVDWAGVRSGCSVAASCPGSSWSGPWSGIAARLCGSRCIASGKGKIPGRE